MLNTWAGRTAIVTLALAAVAFSTRGTAQGGGTPAQIYSGLALFDTYCTMCHGSGGKGDGSFASTLRTPPADLTAIAKNNGGTFSREDVARIIDGRNPLKGHGGKDMPAWGESFSRTVEGPEAVKEKIQSLVNYIESIQQKS